MLLDVDDFIEGGNEMHRETMRKFYDKYRCGKAIDLRLAGQEGTRFAGRRVVQHPDFRITVSMDEYVKSKLRPIEVPRGYLSNTKEISGGMLTKSKESMVFGLAGVNSKTRHGGASLDYSIWV